MSTRVRIQNGRFVRTVSPRELLADLSLGPERSAAVPPRRFGVRVTLRRLRRGALIPLVLTATAALGVGVWATHSSSFINLTVAGATISHNGALWIQGGNPAGTGQFDPFLTLSPSGSADTEQGYNTTEANGEFDTFFGGGRTHPLQAAAIPTVTVGGTVYREFSLDANDTGSDDFMSIDQFKIFLDNQSDLTDYSVATATFGSDDGGTSSAVLIYDMDAGIDGDITALMRSQGLTPGSGVSDITVLVPDSLFPAECFYGSTTCGKWVYLFNRAGAYADNGTDPVAGTQNWNVTAGFEEWRTRLVPVVNVTKTATTSYTQPYDWTVDKKVKVNGTCVDPATVNLFEGDSHDAEWCITATRTAGTPSNPMVSGTVTVTNPTGGAIISESIDAVVTNVTDVITQGATTTPVTLSCPDTFPTTLKATESFTCTYSTAVPSTDAGTNTASATVTGAPAPYTGSATVDFTTASVTTVDATATLTDTEGPLNQAASSGVVVTYVRTYSCNADEGAITNTATVTGDDTGAQNSDSAVLNVNCDSLVVTKDATTGFTRTYQWVIDKLSDDPNGQALTLALGETYVYPYQITVDLDDPPYTDSASGVSGTITVHNPAPITATLTGVADVISGAPTTATVVCGVTFPYDLAAGGDLICTYSAALPDTSDQTNTATATLQNHHYDKDGSATDSGTTDFSGTADVLFANATITEIDECIDVSDTFDGPQGTVCVGDAPATFTYDRTFGPFGEDACGDNTFNNTASFVTNDTGATGSDTWTVVVTVPCPEGCTLTQGYWKTHSSHGPAPEDPNWLLLPGGLGPDTLFFTSGQTWYQVFWTAPKKGNAYYILAHQYEAAILNMLSGADSTAAVDAAITFAETFFGSHTPTSTLSKAERAAVIAAAGVLGSYNEGAIGPGHCSEDTIAVAGATAASPTALGAIFPIGLLPFGLPALFALVRRPRR